MRRVVVTGAGTINPLGVDVPSTFEAMREGRCGIGPLDIRDVDRLQIKVGAQVKDYDEAAHFNRQQIALYDRFTQFALLSARQAIAQAGLTFHGPLADRSGVVLGTSGGGLNTQDENYRAVYEDGKNRVHPFIVPKLMNNAGVSQVAMEWNLVRLPIMQWDKHSTWCAAAWLTLWSLAVLRRCCALAGSRRGRACA